MARVSLGGHIFRLDIHIFRPNIDILRPDINTLRLNMDKSAEGWQKLANAKNAFNSYVGRIFANLR